MPDLLTVPEVDVADADGVVRERLGTDRVAEAVLRVLETVADALSVPAEAELPSAPITGMIGKRLSSGIRFLIMRLREAWSRGE